MDVSPGLNSTSSQFAETGDRPPPAAHRTGRSPSGTSLSVTFCPTPQSDFQQDTCREDASFGLDTEELRKVFLRRTHCPQFSTRATSMSCFGESHPPQPAGKPPVPQPGSVLAAASESPCRSLCVGPGGEGRGTRRGPPASLAVRVGTSSGLLLFCLVWQRVSRVGGSGEGDDSGSFRHEVPAPEGSSRGSSSSEGPGPAPKPTCLIQNTRPRSTVQALRGHGRPGCHLRPPQLPTQAGLISPHVMPPESWR